MTIAQGYKPHPMFHGTDAPRQITSQAERDAAEAEGFTMSYQHQPFPTTLYKNGKSKTVADAKEKKAALSDGWGEDAPVLDGGTEQ